MKNEIEVFKVEITQNRDTGQMRVRVWEIVEELIDEDGPNGASYRVVADYPIRALKTEHRVVTTEKARERAA